MLNSSQIAERCKREIKRSQNMNQLESALQYGLLAKKQNHLTEQDCYDIRYYGFWRKVLLLKGI